MSASMPVSTTPGTGYALSDIAEAGGFERSLPMVRALTRRIPHFAQSPVLTAAARKGTLNKPMPPPAYSPLAQSPLPLASTALPNVCREPKRPGSPRAVSRRSPRDTPRALSRIARRVASVSSSEGAARPGFEAAAAGSTGNATVGSRVGVGSTVLVEGAGFCALAARAGSAARLLAALSTPRRPDTGGRGSAGVF